MTKDGDLKPFKIGDLQKPGGAERPRPLRPDEAKSGEGSGYAYIEGLFDNNDFQPVLGMYESAMEKLKPIALESPDAAKKGEAIRTIHAYDRAMELLTRMLQIRQEMEKEGG
jgi:hypothetical protein